MSIYMKLSTIDGSVTAKGFEKQIELQSFDISGGRKVNAASSSGTKRSSSDAVISEITLTKEWDSAASPKIFQALTAGTLNLTATITFTTAGSKGPEKFLIVDLTDVGITSYSLNDSGAGDEGAYPSETMHLNFSKIELKPFTIGADGKPSAGAVVTYSLPTRETNG